MDLIPDCQTLEYVICSNTLEIFKLMSIVNKIYKISQYLPLQSEVGMLIIKITANRLNRQVIANPDFQTENSILEYLTTKTIQILLKLSTAFVRSIKITHVQ